MIKLLTMLGLVKGIMLEDMDGETYLTWERQGVSGPVAHVYPFMRVGAVKLRSDGSCQQPHYIKCWKYL